jgi:hypothetical protein
MIWTDRATSQETENGMMEEDIGEAMVVTEAEENGEEEADIVEEVIKPSCTCVVGLFER